MKIEKYSVGTGDRFAKEAGAQLAAVKMAFDEGLDIAIVWNKSYREHSIIHTDPASVRSAADTAVKKLNWKGSYYVDADHIGMKTVDLFLESSDFFTLDVAEFIGKDVSKEKLDAFIEKYRSFCGPLTIEGINSPFDVTEEFLRSIARKYLLAVSEAGKLYRQIEGKKGKGNFITEVSMDETESPQTPLELLFILAALADEGIPLQTIAPKFTGRFNKGVDYAGDIKQFEKEFNDDLKVLAFAVREFNIPESLKLSVHSGSDKFSIYPVIKKALKDNNAGLHIKTAGTTWLEELIGLAESGGDGLVIAKKVYRSAYERYDELAAPYADVIDIDAGELPSPDEVDFWSPEQYTAALRHDQSNPAYNLNLRQLLHVGYKVAAEMGEEFLNALEENRDIIAKNVTGNLYERHIKAVFPVG